MRKVFEYAARGIGFLVGAVPTGVGVFAAYKFFETGMDSQAAAIPATFIAMGVPFMAASAIGTRYDVVPHIKKAAMKFKSALPVLTKG